MAASPGWETRVVPSAVYMLVRRAIAARRQVIATYGGHVRWMCPHCIGLNKDGEEQALFFQFGGASSKPLARGGEWRCIPIAGLSDVSVRDGPWHTGGAHSRSQDCVKEVDLSAY